MFECRSHYTPTFRFKLFVPWQRFSQPSCALLLFKVLLLWWDYNLVRKLHWPFKLRIKVKKAITQITLRKVRGLQTLKESLSSGFLYDSLEIISFLTLKYNTITSASWVCIWMQLITSTHKNFIFTIRTYYALFHSINGILKKAMDKWPR